eukprot:Nk52_evm35s1524 gene=Nk52_evmTU35s1524
MPKQYIGSIDQGTSSTRFLLFEAKTGDVVASHQVELPHILPQEGWVEMDPVVIMDSVNTCIDKTMEKAEKQGIKKHEIKAVGITNQRETTIVWDKTTGQPLHNAVVWLDMRTAETSEKLIKSCPGEDKLYLQPRCGLPISTYFSAVKMRWLFDNVPAVEFAFEEDRLMVGTVDTWVIWNLTGGLKGGQYVTDVTNASRTMLMNINSLKWDPALCKFFGVHERMLPRIASSAEVYGQLASGALKGTPLSGCLGDQQAALVGQQCFNVGDAKNTYGTGCFLLYNTGPKPVLSNHGLLTTVGYQFGKHGEPVYALEGSVAIAGAAVRWLRDNLQIIKTSEEVGVLADKVSSSAGVYFVPAFSGLYAPYWRPDARGCIVGMTQYTNKNHIARATLEAVCFQLCEILNAMNMDCGIPLASLKVDGGMTINSTMMQIQADLLGIPVVRPSMAETTALGAAIAAGIAVGVFKENEIGLSISTSTFKSKIDQQERTKRMHGWKKAIHRALGWTLPVGEDHTVKSGSGCPVVPFSLGAACAVAVTFAYCMMRNR